MAKNMFAFSYEKFNEWEDNTHIPADIMKVVNAVAKEFGLDEVEEITIEIRNRGGYTCGYTKGFSLTHCTSSYYDGPTPDYSKTFLKFIGGLGFYVANSYGDNGMDTASNWHDTYWIHEIGYHNCDTNDNFVEWTGTDEELEEYNDEYDPFEYYDCEY